MTKATDSMRAANLKHGHTTWRGKQSPEYQSWTGAKKRCYNKNCKAYHRYGALGIVMSDAWKDDFLAFVTDMGPKPSNEHSLDRIDNAGPYSKENCRWATRSQQNRNRSSVFFVEYQGQKMPLIDVCEIIGAPYNRVLSRMKRCGWSFEAAISKPKLRLRRRQTSNTVDIRDERR